MEEKMGKAPDGLAVRRASGIVGVLVLVFLLWAVARPRRRQQPQPRS